MPTCPICLTPLQTTRQREGLIYPCNSCAGRAITVSQIRHAIGDAIAMRLIRLLKLSHSRSEHGCPFCSAKMLTVSSTEPPLRVEACRACSVFWFDLPTYESLPQLTLETTNSIPMQATEIIAINRLKKLKEKEEAERRAEKERKRRRRISGVRLGEEKEQ